jgi:hypothetical protein
MRKKFVFLGEKPKTLLKRDMGLVGRISELPLGGIVKMVGCEL